MEPAACQFYITWYHIPVFIVRFHNPLFPVPYPFFRVPTFDRSSDPEAPEPLLELELELEEDELELELLEEDDDFHTDQR